MPNASAPSVYYAHPLCTYGYPCEAQSLERIAQKFPRADLTNPGTYGKYPMSFFLSLVEQCDVLVFERLKGEITAGVGKEIAYALQRKKTVFELTQNGKFMRITKAIPCLDPDQTIALYPQFKAEQGIQKIPLLMSKGDYQRVKDPRAEWNDVQQSWFWPINAPRELVAGWLPQMYQPKTQPPYLLSGMVPRSMWGVNLRSLFPERWKKISREIREKYGHRCQICGNVAAACHEDWQYVFDATAIPKAGIQRLQQLVSLCEGCHSVKHLGRTESQGQLEVAMQHWAFVNGWSLRKAYVEREKAWVDWRCRNEYRWTLDIALMERDYGWPIQAHWKNILTAQSATRNESSPLIQKIDPVTYVIKMTVPDRGNLPDIGGKRNSVTSRSASKTASAGKIAKKAAVKKTASRKLAIAKKARVSSTMETKQHSTVLKKGPKTSKG